MRRGGCKGLRMKQRSQPSINVPSQGGASMPFSQLEAPLSHHSQPLLAAWGRALPGDAGA